MFKIYRETSPEIMQDTFLKSEQGHYNLRNVSDFIILKVKSVNFGFEIIRYLGPKIWDSLPQSLKNKELADSFKTSIKTWSQIDVLARFVKLICKTLDTCRGKSIIFIRLLTFLSIFYFYLWNQRIYF